MARGFNCLKFIPHPNGLRVTEFCEIKPFPCPDRVTKHRAAVGKVGVERGGRGTGAGKAPRDQIGRRRNL